MAIMEGIDLEIQSWFVDASEIEFCRRPDGSDWLLGEGSYGKVRGSGFRAGVFRDGLPPPGLRAVLGI